MDISNYRIERTFIDGQWRRSASGERIPVYSPATEQQIGHVPLCSPTDVDAAVAAARRSFDQSGWAGLDIRARAAILRRAAQIMRGKIDRFQRVAADESGLPIGFVYGDGSTFSHQSIKLLEYYAALGERISLEEERTGADGGRVIVRREPVGVVGVITPWNAPTLIAMFSLAPALLAGCSIILKPAPESPLHAVFLAQVFEEAGLPAGVFNLVTTGLEGSQTLVEHPDVDKIVFTGSTTTGRVIGSSCGRQIKRCCLELGGKSAAIVMEDADLNALIPFLTFTAYMNNGEACIGQTRILAPRKIYDQVVERMAAVVAQYPVGSPLDAGTVIGPLITERQRAVGESYIASARAEGAEVVTGGARPQALAKGWFLEPTLLANVTPSMKVAREEIFCPVVVVMPYEGLDDAITIANDSEYGLSGSVWTANEAEGLEVARRIRTGNIGINCFNLDYNAPFGGFKRSGIGRQLGPEGLDGFFEYKAINFPIHA